MYFSAIMLLILIVDKVCWYAIGIEAY